MRMWNAVILQDTDLRKKKQAVQYHANVSFHFRLKVLIFHSPSSFFSFFLFQGDCIIYRILLYKQPGLNLINKKSLWKADSRFRKKKWTLNQVPAKRDQKMKIQTTTTFIFFSCILVKNCCFICVLLSIELKILLFFCFKWNKKEQLY